MNLRRMGSWLGLRIGTFFTNLDQPMPLPSKISKLVQNLSRRVILRQTCCGHAGEPGC